VKPTTQGLVAAVLGAVVLRLALTDEYLHYVQAWMKVPLVLAGLALLGMGIRPALGRTPLEGRVPRTSWLLLLPTLIVFAVAPPPLGAFIAERRAPQAPSTLKAPTIRPVSDGGRPLDLAVEEFVWGAAQTDDPMSLHDRTVRLRGFVSADKAGHWYITALVIYCCAADVAVERVKVADGPSAPPRDSWVSATGTLVDGTGTDADIPATLAVTDVVEIPTPENPYS